MSEVLVGSAYSIMELRYQQFTQGASIVEQTIQRLLALSKTPITVQAQIGSGAGSGAGALPAPAARGGGAAPGVDADAAAYTRLQRAQASLEQQQARLARQQGDTARAAQLEAQAQERLTTELQAQNGVTVQSIAIERQLASVQQQSERAAQQEAKAQKQAMDAMRASVAPVQQLGAATRQNATIAQEFGSAAKSSLLSIAGPAAAVAVIFKGIGAAVQGVGEALELRETKNSLRAVAGDTQTYAQVIRTAREEQVLFGGTLQDNIEGLQGLAITARSSGAQLTTLIDLQKRLAILDPAQGAGGARIALNEALSGDPTSLAKRYEIPRLALAKLRDTSIPVEERLKVIDSFLNKVGITSESVAGKVDQDALAFRRLGQELGDAKLNAGSEIATAFSGTATGLARVVGLINQNPQAIAELKALLGRGPVTQGGIDDITKQIAEQQAKFSLARGQSQGRAEANIGGAAQYQEAIDLLTQLKLAGNDAGDALTRQYQQNTLSGDEYLQKLREITTADAARAAGTDAVSLAQNAARDTAARVGAAFDDERRMSAQLSQSFLDLRNARYTDTQAIAEQQAKQQAGTLATQEAAQAQSLLAQLGSSVAQGFQSSGAAALVYANQLHIAYGQALDLINAQAQIAGAANNAKALADQRAGERSGGRFQSTSDQKAFADSQRQQALAANQAAEAQARYQQALGNSKPLLTYLRQQLAQVAKGSKEYYDIQSQIVGIEKAGGRTRVDAAQATGLQLAQTEQNSQAAILKAQREGQERLRDSEQDYQLSRTRKQEDYEEQRRKLLEGGQRKQADLLAQQFAKEQRRAAEDFNIQRQRTLRNNAESTGDIDASADRRQQQIGQRAALRGVRPAGGAPVDLGSAPPTLTGGGSQAQAVPPILVRVQVQPVSVQINSHTIVDLTWPETEQRVANAIATVTLPPPSQTAVAGSPP